MKRLLNKNIWIILITVLILIKCKVMVPVECPPTCFSYTHPEKFYPDAIKTTNTTVKNAVNILGKVTANSENSTIQSAQALKVQLNQFGSLSSELIKNQFLICNQRPCDLESVRRLNDLIAITSKQNFQIQNILDKDMSNPNGYDKIIDTLKNVIGKNAIDQATIIAGNIGKKDTFLMAQALKHTPDLSEVVVVSFPSEPRNQDSHRPYIPKYMRNVDIVESENRILEFVSNTTNNDSLGSKNSWVYFGQFLPTKNKWSYNCFNWDSIPIVGTDIKSECGISIRNNFPIKIPNSLNNWKMGDFIGILPQNNRVKVQEVKIIEGNNYWIRIKNLGVSNDAVIK